jgi:ribose-phosphate pyrophosphokinase
MSGAHLAGLGGVTPKVKKRFRLFGINGSIPYASKVAEHLGVPMAAVKEKHFTDGEVLACPNDNVRNCDCYFIFDPYTDLDLSVNDKLMMTWIFIHALKKASARSVTWIKRPPAYDRQDRKTKPREPVTTQVMGMIMDALYLDRLITLDPHSLVATNNNLRRCNVDVLQARKVLADAIVQHIDDPDKLVIQAPDEGAVNRHVKPARRSLEKRLSEKFGRKIRIPMSYFDKEHAEEQEDKDVLVWDDMFGTGGTVRQNREAIELNGGRLRYAVATHGYFTEKKDKTTGKVTHAYENFEGVEHVFISDSMGCSIPWRLNPDNIPLGWEYEAQKKAELREFLKRLHVVDTSRFMADVLCETSKGGSINTLLSD